MPHKSSFDIKGPRDFFEIVVLPQHADFVANNASKRHALLAIIVAYHMYEWVNGAKFTVEAFEAAYPAAVEVIEIFELARNVANGTKHFKPRAQTRTQKGFSSGFSDGFARPLIVQFPDGRELSADHLLRRMMVFWEDQKIAGAF